MRVICYAKRVFVCFLLISCALFPACGEFTNSWYSDIPQKVTEYHSPTIVTLSWQHPTINTDGSPLTDLNRYKVYYGTSSRDYPNSIDVGVNNTASVGDLSPGTWYFTVTAIDHSGNESGFSNEVQKNIK